MNFLLWTDPHFTDTPLEEYRWDVFKHILEFSMKYDVGRIYCLGDLVDRKDRHSAVLVNNLVDNFSWLQVKLDAELKVLSGNHEKPVTGPYYWNFLSKLGVEYITKPKLEDGIWFLPFASNPAEEWKDFDFNVKAILMHQTGQGVKVEGDRLLSSNNLPKFPAVPVFSGDVHRPQKADGIEYIGTPHPVRFSESWNNRLIIIQNEDFNHPLSIWLPSIRRAILDIKSSDELYKTPYQKGDQLKIRYTLSGDQLALWHEEETRIREWAKEKGILLASLEPRFTGEGVQVKNNTEKMAFQMMSPDEVIKKYAADEKLDEGVLEVGRELMKAV